MPDIPDEELMIRFQQGSIGAFEILFEKYRGPVFNFLYRMLNRQDDAAEDLLQEVFVKLVRARDFYEPRAKFSTWLFAIARNHCLNYLRSRRYAESRRSVSFEGDAAELKAGLAAREESRRKLEQKETQELLENAILSLPDDYREVFLLRAVQGFSHAEVSQMLKVNPATVRTHYHRARLMLKEKVGALLAEGDENP